MRRNCFNKTSPMRRRQQQRRIVLQHLVLEKFHNASVPCPHRQMQRHAVLRSCKKVNAVLLRKQLLAQNSKEASGLLRLQAPIAQKPKPTTVLDHTLPL